MATSSHTLGYPMISSYDGHAAQAVKGDVQSPDVPGLLAMHVLTDYWLSCKLGSTTQHLSNAMFQGCIAISPNSADSFIFALPVAIVLLLPTRLLMVTLSRIFQVYLQIPMSSCPLLKRHNGFESSLPIPLLQVLHQDGHALHAVACSSTSYNCFVSALLCSDGCVLRLCSCLGCLGTCVSQ